MLNEEKIQLKSFFDDLVKRKTKKPQITQDNEHLQLNQFPESDEFALEIHTYIKTFPSVVIGDSLLIDNSTAAYFMEENTNLGTNARFLKDNEFAHLHDHESNCFTLVLPSEIGKITDKLGFTENHPLSKTGEIPHSNYLLFGARDSQEMEVSKIIVRISYLFSSNQW